MKTIDQLNVTVADYFDKNKSINEIPAKDLMPLFVEKGVFTADSKDRPGKPLRDLLRKLDKENNLQLIPLLYADRKGKNTFWFFRRNGSVSDLKFQFVPEKILKAAELKNVNSISKRKNRDEDYILELCDSVLAQEGKRQHKFSFLLGDSGRRLPVDIYYPTLNLVIEYREYQHTNAVLFFDKKDKITVSGVSRGEQRRIYDQRRRVILPIQGIHLIEINYDDFGYKKNNRLLRNKDLDIATIKNKLQTFLKNK
ncbi:hypothetical protein [Sphingobacterium sp. WOUb80]|uniref:hypothetical protein n=1 Tax=Sphingobacterium sp. WOUb80 TaxID=3234028 RepID=UPI003CEA50D9